MPEYYHRRFIILGGEGFLGRHLAGTLRQHGTVQTFDRPALDVTDSDQLSNLVAKLGSLSDERPLAVVNATGVLDARLSRRDPELFYRVNGMAVSHVLDFASKVDANTLVHFSSETVYGQTDDPVVETAPRKPLHPYGISKLLGECFLETAQYDGLAAISLRIPFVVGPDVALDNQVTLFCNECTTNGTVTVFNGGGHERNFVDVGDFVRQVEAILSQPHESGYHVYNIAGFSISMRNLADIVIRQVGRGSVVHEESVNQAFSLLSSGKKLVDRFGANPTVDIEQMVMSLLGAKKGL